MAKKSIQTELTAVLVVVSFLGMTAVFVLSYFAMRGGILEELLAKTRNMVAVEAQTMDGWFDHHIAFVDVLGTALSEMNDPDFALRILQAQYARSVAQNEGYLDVYVGLSDDKGLFASDPPDPNSGWCATQRPWYQSAMARKGKVIITDPYQDAVTGFTVITITKDIGKFGDLGGAVAVDVEIKTIVQAMKNIETFGGYAFLVDSDGLIIAHPDEQFNPKGEDDYVRMADDKVYATIFPATKEVYDITDYDGIKRYLFPCRMESSGWVLYVAIPHTVVAKTINPDATTIIIAVAFLLAAAVVVSLVVRIKVVKPLVQVVKAGTKIAQGELDVELKTNSKNELGHLVEQFALIVDVIKKQTYVLESVSRKDFTVNLESRSSHDTMNIAIQTMIQTTSDMLHDIAETATQVSAGAHRIFSGTEALEQGSSAQTVAVQGLSASTTRIADQTKANAEMAGRAAKLADAIKIGAEKGSRQMNEMINAVNEINKASHSIGDVIKVIDDIAFQTNLLALNAAVEAARAGQHGKGFAVVAEEVRNLATKSAEAAKNTGELIVNSIKKAKFGAEIAQETAASLEEIVSGINESNQIITDIAKSSAEQSRGIGEINNGIEQVAHIVQQNNASAEQSATVSRELTGQSNVLQELISQFRLTETKSHYRQEGAIAEGQI